MRKKITAAALATVLALGGVLSVPTAASADLRPTCSSSREFDAGLGSGKTYLCARFEAKTLFFSAVMAHLRGFPGNWTFEGNIVVTRDGATVAAYPFSRTLKDFALVGGADSDELANHFSLPIFVPGDYEIIMDGHVIGKRPFDGAEWGQAVIKVDTVRLPIAL
ncbi:hypothetical protein [Microbacterium sp. 1.5R]|uniref:hypothetical protein n=1 Tax=Microbacterium sp. 1.5R TaxID=1916917 RepID=UPI0011A152C1|nr:hypothetical protein [Microbacterium sp. 1.5R]